MKFVNYAFLLEIYWVFEDKKSKKYKKNKLLKKYQRNKKIGLTNISHKTSNFQKRKKIFFHILGCISKSV